MIAILGILDLLAAVVLVLSHYGLIIYGIAILFVIYLMAKLFIFKDFISFIDFLAGFYLVLIFYGVHTFIVWIFAFYLLQKSITSFLNL